MEAPQRAEPRKDASDSQRVEASDEDASTPALAGSAAADGEAPEPAVTATEPGCCLLWARHLLCCCCTDVFGGLAGYVLCLYGLVILAHRWPSVGLVLLAIAPPLLLLALCTLRHSDGLSAAQKKDMRTKEIKNGRVAMIAVLAYVGGEAVTGKPVTELTPAFFRPIWAVVGAAAEPVAAAAAPVMAAAAAPVAAAAAPVTAASTAATEYIAAVYSDMVGTVPTTAATEYAAAVYSDMQSLVPDVVQAAASIP